VLVQRKDDRDEVVTERLEVYAQQTEPLVVYYKRLGLLRVVNGERDIEAIRKDLIGIVNSL
jgi:adenylate kinase